MDPKLVMVVVDAMHPRAPHRVVLVVWLKSVLGMSHCGYFTLNKSCINSAIALVVLYNSLLLYG